MTILNNLRNASSLNDFAKMLGYKPSSLSYIIYKIPSENKYKKFCILKKRRPPANKCPNRAAKDTSTAPS